MKPIHHDSPCPAAAPTPRRPPPPGVAAGRAFAAALGEDETGTRPEAAAPLMPSLPGLPAALPLPPAPCTPSARAAATAAPGAAAPKPAAPPPVTSQVSAGPLPVAPGLPATTGTWQLELGRGLPAAQLQITRQAGGQLDASLTAALPALAAAATRRLGQRLAERGVRLQHAAATEPACGDTPAATAAGAAVPTPPSGQAHA
jgi:hypothetical protein